MTDYFQLIINGAASAFGGGFIQWVHERHLKRRLTDIEQRLKKVLLSNRGKK